MLVVLLAVVAPWYGVLGVAYAIAGVVFVGTLADYALVSVVLNIDARKLVAAVWRSVAAAAVMAIAVGLERAGNAPASNLAGHAWSIAESAALGAAVYVGCVWGLWIVGGRGEGAEARLIALAKNYCRVRRAQS